MNSTEEESESETMVLCTIFVVHKDTKSILLFDSHGNGSTGFCFKATKITNEYVLREKSFESLARETDFCVNEKNPRCIKIAESDNSTQLLFTIIITEFDYPQNFIPSNSKWWHKNQLRLGQIIFNSKKEESFVMDYIKNL